VNPSEDDVMDEDDFVPDGLWNDALEDLLNLAPHLETLDLVFIGERVAGYTTENGLGVSTKLRSVRLIGLEMPRDPCAYPSVRELTIGMVDLDPDLYPVSAAAIARAFPKLRSLHLGTLELHAVDGLDELIDLRWLTANDAYTVDGSPIPVLTQARLRTRAEHPIWDAVAE
jgi:hypothetical protein